VEQREGRSRRVTMGWRRWGEDRGGGGSVGRWM
jgi:hypothetical protein